jgi:ELWxxDGT repeat protein
MVKDIVIGSDGSRPNGLTVHKNELFFVCEKDSTNTDALWKTDGTTNGTVRVKRPFPNGLSNIKNLFSTDTYLYFSATNGVNGTELWRTNGTDTGTVMVFDLNVGAASSSPDNFTFYKNDLFFVADNGTTGRELWRLTSSPNVSVKESSAIDILLFPNPTSEYITIQQEETGKAYSINLFDNSGKLMIGNVLLNSGNTQMDVHTLPSGLYFLEIKEKSGIKSIIKKVVITR